MNFTDGEDVFYERLMKQVPHFDKSPMKPRDMELDCELCADYRPRLHRCKYAECPYKKTTE